MFGFIKNIFSKKVKDEVKQNCLTCKFNTGDNCTVGSDLARQGIVGYCYAGELWKSKNDKTKFEFIKEELIKINFPIDDFESDVLEGAGSSIPTLAELSDEEFEEFYLWLTDIN